MTNEDHMNWLGKCDVCGEGPVMQLDWENFKQYCEKHKVVSSDTLKNTGR